VLREVRDKQVTEVYLLHKGIFDRERVEKISTEVIAKQLLSETGKYFTTMKISRHSRIALCHCVILS
jgi:hypothetical protein